MTSFLINGSIVILALLAYSVGYLDGLMRVREKKK